MSTSNGSVLILHKGSRSVNLEELRAIKPPPPKGRWHPIAHARVYDVVSTALVESGYVVAKSNFGVSPDGHRFFGTLDLGSDLVHGVKLAVGIRNSNDKTFPLGFCAGNRTVVCDNLAFSAELLVKRRHTLRGESNFVSAIAGAVTSLQSFKNTEASRLKRFATTELSPEMADALILRAYERGILGARELPRVIREWRTPSHDDFQPRTVLSLLNAFTGALKERTMARPSEYASMTIRLNGMLDQEGIVQSLPVHVEPATAA